MTLIKPEIAFADFEKIDMRCGKIIEVQDFEKARKPSWRLKIDFGDEIGVKQSSAQITAYSKQALLGVYVIAVVNLAPRNIGGFMSEVLVLGVSDSADMVRILSPLADGASLIVGSFVH